VDSKDRIRRYFGMDGTREPMPAQNPRNRRILAAFLGVFIVLNVLTASWVYVALASLWLVLIVVRELLDRRRP
jgi:hypothetical protein